MLESMRDKTVPDVAAKLDGLTDEVQSRSVSSMMIWAGVALFLVGAAVMGLRSETGHQRIARLFAPAPPTQPARAEAPRPASADPMLVYETRRLAEQVRVLSAERDAITERLASLERSFGDVTASVPRQESVRQEASRLEMARADLARPESARPEPARAEPARAEPSRPEPARVEPSPAARAVRVLSVGGAGAAGQDSSGPVTTAAIPPGSAPTTAPIPIPSPQAIAFVGQVLASPSPAGAPSASPNPATPAAAQPSAVQPALLAAPAPDAQESVAIRTDFGVDLAGEATIEALRTRWQQLRAQHGPVLEGLRPVVGVNEGARPGSVELRLVAGPLSNANAAARLCATLSLAGLICKPTVFDGQRLALR